MGCHVLASWSVGPSTSLPFLRATAGTAVTRLSHRNSVRPSVRPSVCPSVRHTGGSVKNGES